MTDLLVDDSHGHDHYDDNIAALGRNARVRANIAAIRLARQLHADTRAPDHKERAVLDRFTGWGGVAPIFDPRGGTAIKPPLRDELRHLLGREEWHAAAAATLTAYHTPRRLAATLGRGLVHLGFSGGTLLDPGAGTGAMLAGIPREIADRTRITAVECNSTVAGLLQLLHPQANVIAERLERTALPDGIFHGAIGNLPFANVLVADRRYRHLSPLLHDYMLLRTVDMLRPGAIAVLITSRGFLDKDRDAVRIAVRDRAELIAAYRLPATAFLRHSRTNVVADVLVLRRRPDVLATLPDDERRSLLLDEFDWTVTRDISVSNADSTVSAYFANNPDHVLGTLELTPGPHGPALSVRSAADDVEIARQLESHLLSLAPGARRIPAGGDVAPAHVQRPTGSPRHILGASRGEILRWGAQGYALAPVAPEVSARFTSLLHLRDALRAAIAAQADAEPPPVRAGTRAVLRARHAAFVSRYGRVSAPINASLFEDDPDYALLGSLEIHTAAGLRDADILHRDIGAASAAPHGATDVDQAIAISLDQTATIDVGLVAHLLSLPPDEIPALAGDRIFLDPDAHEWVPADEYLSGDVRRKLDIARAAASADTTFARNVIALEAVQPSPIPFNDIDVPLGAAWIPDADYAAFAASILSDTGEDKPLAISQNPVDASFNVHASDRSTRIVQATQTWGTARRPFPRLLEHLLNGTPIVVRDRLDDGRSVVNLRDTESAQSKAGEIQEAWADWIWTEPSRRERLAARYNTLMNREVPPTYDAAHLSLPGLSPVWRQRVRPVQRNVAWRVIRHGAALVGHEMSVGKTLSLAIIAMECRRLGRARRPLLAVKAATFDDIVAAVREYYPQANILSLGEAATPRHRHQFLARLATGDADIAITTHDAFDLIAVSPETEAAVINEQIDDHREALVSLDPNGRAGSRTVKQLEAAIKRLEVRLETLAAGPARDDVLFYEQLGIDLLLIDEAHRYKALPVATRDPSLKGVPRTASKRALHLLMAARITAETNARAGRRGRGLVLATGTPVTNTIPEVFTLQRYLQPDVLADRRIAHFDPWLRLFGRSEQRLELSVAGDYRLTTRLCKFVNLPELARMVSPIFDVVFAEDIDLKRPRQSAQVVAVQPTTKLRAIMTWLKDRAEHLSGSTSDNMLAISSDGRKAALDPRLVLDSGPDNAGGKLAEAASRIARIARQTPGSVQLVFLDIGLHPIAAARSAPEISADDTIPEDAVAATLDAASDSDFSARNELVRLLVEDHGMERGRVLDFIEMRGSPRRRAMQALRSGRAQVAIGSTELLGTGVNVQDRVLAIHHIDAPWLPASLAQRDARGVRHGNHNETVYTYRYVTVGSFDAFMWQCLDTKARFIRQFLDACRGRSIDTLGREIRNDDTAVLSPGQVMAIAAGNPLLLRKAELDDHVRRLARARQRFHQMRAEAATTATTLSARLDATRTHLGNARTAAESARRLAAQPFHLAVRAPDGPTQPFTTRTAAAAALQAAITAHYEDSCGSARPVRGAPIAHRGDFILTVSVELSRHHGWSTTLHLQHDPSGAHLLPLQVAYAGTGTCEGTLRSLDRQIARYSDLPARFTEQADLLVRDMAAAENLTARVFPHELDLATARADLARIERILSLPDPDPARVQELRAHCLTFERLDHMAATSAALAVSLDGAERHDALHAAAAYQALANEADPAAKAYRAALEHPADFPQPSNTLLDLPPIPDAADHDIPQDLLTLFKLG